MEALAHYHLKGKHFQLVQSDALMLPFTDGCFDVVLTLESIEHFSRADAELYLSEMRRVLAPHGIMLGTTPLCYHPALVALFRVWNEYHLYAYTATELRAVLNRCFGAVTVFERYNPTCPYLLFLCAPDRERLAQPDVADLRSHLRALQREGQRFKAQNLATWGDALYHHGQHWPALRLMLDAWLVDPGNFRTGHLAVRALFGPRLWSIVRCGKALFTHP
jgi:SAM-dependent methyltransferase